MLIENLIDNRKSNIFIQLSNVSLLITVSFVLLLKYIFTLNTC